MEWCRIVRWASCEVSNVRLRVLTTECGPEIPREEYGKSLVESFARADFVHCFLFWKCLGGFVDDGWAYEKWGRDEGLAILPIHDPMCVAHRCAEQCDCAEVEAYPNKMSWMIILVLLQALVLAFILSSKRNMLSVVAANIGKKQVLYFAPELR